MMNSYQPGELIFVQGQASECVYLIESGEIELLESTEDMEVVRARPAHSTIGTRRSVCEHPVGAALDRTGLLRK